MSTSTTKTAEKLQIAPTATTALLSTTRPDDTQQDTRIIDVERRLLGVERSIRNRLDGLVRGKPDTTPHPAALRAIELLSPLNPNNAGIHRRSERAAANPWQATRDLETEVVEDTIRFLGAEPSHFSGHLTTGATESNITAIWWARNRAEAERATLHIVAPATVHYSIQKAADLAGLTGEVHIVPVDRDLQISLSALTETLETLDAQDDIKVLCVATLITTATGTVDDLERLNDVLTEFPGLAPEVHVDAAIGAFILPFLAGWRPWSDQHLVRSFGIDWHKLGGLPYQAGMLVYRADAPDFLQAIEMISTGRDETLVGSRSGVSAAAVWATFQSLGVDGFERRAAHVTDLACVLADGLSDLGLEVRQPAGSNVVTIEAPTGSPLDQRLTEVLPAFSSYGSSVLGHEHLRFYPLFCMPHNDVGAVNRIITIISQEVVATNE